MKNYITPEIEITATNDSDIMTASNGDTPVISFEW